MPSKIEWTDETWNPLVGCERVSPGCLHCYAIRTCARGLAEQHVGLTKVTSSGRLDWTGEFREVPEQLPRPLRWRKPRRVFVNSLSDLFAREVRREFVADVFAVMALSPAHSFQILTKRAEHMFRVMTDSTYQGEPGVVRTPRFRDLVAERVETIAEQFDRPAPADLPWPLPNVWLGVSIESSLYSSRADWLRSTPAAIRFVSAEPLIGSLAPQRNGGTFLDLEAIDWLIVGGESGHRARPMHPLWVDELLDMARASGTAFLLKQWGEWLSYTHSGRVHSDELTSGKAQQTMDYLGRLLDPDAECDPDLEPSLFVRMGKGAAGREYRGRTWDEMPRASVEA